MSRPSLRPLLLGLLSVGLLACSEPTPAPEPAPPAPPPAPRRGWSSQALGEAGFEVSALACGELLAAEGLEVVAAGSKGELVVAQRRGEGWRLEPVDAGAGPLSAALVADLDPTLEGAELIVAGASEDGRGRVEALHWTASAGWRARRLWSAAQPVRALASQGSALAVAGEALTVLTRHEGAWTALREFPLPSPGLSLVALADGFAVGCADGELVVARIGVDAGLEARDRRVTGRLGLAASGGHLLSADADGTLCLLPAKNGSGLPERLLGQDRVEVYRSPRPLRSAVLADLDPDHEGLELVAASEDGQVVVLARDPAGSYQAEAIAREPAPWRALAVAGPRALVAAGQGGSLVWLEYRP